jgi:hypothetical protein
MFGLSKEKKLETPLGSAVVRTGFVEVLSWRYRGVLIEVAWPENSPCPTDQFFDIRGDFDRLLQVALTFLGVDDFPPELRTIVPERIEFGTADDWSLTFHCPEWPDAWWTVTFKHGKPNRMHHGD